jgi:DNA damage-binding protein 1
VVSFINETRIFLFDSDGDVEELDNFKCFNLKEETLTAVCLSGGRFLQVTTSRLIIVDAEAGTVVSQRSTPNKVTAASANDDVLVCNIGYKTIIIYDLKHELMMVSKRFFDNEVSCIYATPDFPDLCVVGFWNIATIQLLSLPSLENISEESLSMGTDELAIPRSIIIAKILKNQDPFLLVAMGDGILYTFSMNPAKKYLLSQKKAIALESQSFYFQAMAGEDDTVSVFAACDQPSFIYAVDGQIRYCAFTTEKVRLLAPFNNQAFPSSVVNIANGELKISLIDTTRSIHIKKLPVGEVIRRIAYSNEKQIYGIITVRSSIDIYTGGETYISNVRLVSGVELSIVESYELLKHELVESILCARLDNGDGTWSEKFIVGTGFQPNHRGESNPTNGDGAGDECKEGRLLVFEVSEDRKFKIAAELKIHGSVKALDMMDDKIVTACNKTVCFSTDHDLVPNHR